jgi:hypothetical protein
VRRLAFVLAAAMVPAVLVGLVFMGYDYYDRERARLVRDSLAVARALSAAVDADLAATRAALLVLATSPYLTRADLAAFHAQAAEVAREQGFTTIALMDRNGRQFVNTVRRFGEPLPTQGDPAGLTRMFETEAPIVSDLVVGRVLKRGIVAVGVPVRHEGKVIYALNAVISPERVSALLAGQHLPGGRIGVVVDRRGTIVGRTHDAARWVGQPASADLRRGMEPAAEGDFEGRTVEGTPVLTVFSRSPQTGWTVAIGIPLRELEAHLLSSLGRLFVVGFITLVIALVLGLVLARRLLPLRGLDTPMGAASRR